MTVEVASNLVHMQTGKLVCTKKRWETKEDKTERSNFRPDFHIFKTLQNSSSSSSTITKNSNTKTMTSKGLTLQSMTQRTLSSFSKAHSEAKKIPTARSIARPIKNNTNGNNRNRKSSSSNGKRKRSRFIDEGDETDDDLTDQEYGPDGEPLDMRSNTPEIDEDWTFEKEEEESNKKDKVIAVLSDQEEEEDDEEEEEEETPALETEGEEEELEIDSDEDDDEDVPTDVGIALNKPERMRTTTIRVTREQVLPSGQVVPYVHERKICLNGNSVPIDYALDHEEEDDDDEEENHYNHKKQKTGLHTSMNGNGKPTIQATMGDRDFLPPFLQKVQTVDEARSAIQAQFESDFKNVVYIASLRKSHKSEFDFLIKPHNSQELMEIQKRNPRQAELIQSYSNWSQMRGDFLRTILCRMAEEEMEHVSDILRAASTSDHVTSHSLEDHLRDCGGLDEKGIQAAVHNSSELLCYISERRLSLETGRVIHIRLPVVSMELHHGAGAAKVTDDNIFYVHIEHEAYVLDHWFLLRIFNYISDYFEKWQTGIKEKLGIEVDGERFLKLKNGHILRSLLCDHRGAFTSLAYTWSIACNEIDYGVYKQALLAVKKILGKSKK